MARVYGTLGGKAVATGFLGGNNGRIVARALAEEGTQDAFVRVRGESRLCIAVVDPANGTQTEVNERGKRATLLPEDPVKTPRLAAPAGRPGIGVAVPVGLEAITTFREVINVSTGAIGLIERTL